MDFLSAVTLGMAEDGDSLVLNSVANVDRSFRYLDGYERIRCYLDNDEAGHRTVENCGCGTVRKCRTAVGYTKAART